MDASLSPTASVGCDHAALRADPARFAALAALKAPHNTMPTYADAGEPDTLLLADCPHCSSTLCREVYASDLTRWTWRNVTADHPGFRHTTFIEVGSSDGWTLLSFDEDGDITVIRGAAIDWADVVVADVRGKRAHEEVGCDGEQSAFARVA